MVNIIDISNIYVNIKIFINGHVAEQFYPMAAKSLGAVIECVMT